MYLILKQHVLRYLERFYVLYDSGEDGWSQIHLLVQQCFFYFIGSYCLPIF